MSVANQQNGKQGLKLEKRRMKRVRKQAKLAQKLARRQEKLARKQARRDMRIVVGSKSYQPREQAIAVLEDILNGLKSGAISVEQGEQKVSLRPPENLRVAVRARQTHKTERVRFCLSWPRQEGIDPIPSVKVAAEKPD